ncbi:Hypothetical predicted protein [Olea europaea subsp. europaea]|uniref:Uncharacterized protein n=1 Tax=Olea europaea subsp. europaea TaxID=158383 RepID=A0A8S0PXK6_OLEEU|nr:Hypothetical predicted protein [Olea europaea subsp. europaea]
MLKLSLGIFWGLVEDVLGINRVADSESPSATAAAEVVAIPISVGDLSWLRRGLGDLEFGTVGYCGTSKWVQTVFPERDGELSNFLMYRHS